MFAKSRTSNKIILFINIIHVHNMKNDYDVKFQIMILGYILSGLSQFRLKQITVLYKKDTYTLEEQESREKICSKNHNAQLRVMSHCFYSASH